MTFSAMTKASAAAAVLFGLAACDVGTSAREPNVTTPAPGTSPASSTAINPVTGTLPSTNTVGASPVAPGGSAGAGGSGAGGAGAGGAGGAGAGGAG
jgi:hypothetical protein